MAASSLTLFSEQGLRVRRRKHNQILVAAIVLATLGLFGFLFAFSKVDEAFAGGMEGLLGEGAGDAAIAAVAFGGFVLIFLAPILIAAGYAGRHIPACPSCQQRLLNVNAVLSTRCCPACAAQIVAGERAHTYEAWHRAQRINFRRSLGYFLWACPGFAAIVLIGWSFSPSSPRQYGLIVAPLLGTITAGHSWLRTFDRRYLGQFVSSTLLLGVFGYLIWRVW